MEQCSGGGWPRHSWQRRQVHCSDRGEWESLRRHASRRLRLRFVAVEAALLLFTWQPSELFGNCPEHENPVFCTPGVGTRDCKTRRTLVWKRPSRHVHIVEVELERP